VSIDISMLGDRELEKTLARLPDVAQKRVVRKAFTKGGRVVLAAVKRHTPVKTGALKKGIKSRAGKARRGAVVRSVMLPYREELGIPADAKHYYPAAVEYGHGNVPPHSFLRKGYDEVEEQVFSLVKREIGDGIQREFLKL
jgi:HK97 gp10 family phage protein